MTIEVTDGEVRVHLKDGERWNEQWPSVDPPRGMYLFPIDAFCQWQDTDFHAHFWCRPLAEFLDAQRTILKFALSYLKVLLAFSWEIEKDVQMKTIFRSLQVFARLSLMYAQARGGSNTTVLEHKSFIIEGLRAGLDKSNHVVARQVTQIAKNFESPRISNHFAKNTTRQRNPQRSFPPRQSQRRSVPPEGRRGPNGGRGPQCFKCGKWGHIKRNCKSSAPVKK